ncbi:MAG: helix-turn-helix domain-containing protein [Planctomycetota bacterium]
MSEALPLAQVTKLVPGHPTVNTLRRWIHRGIDGRRLEACRRGRQIYTSPAAIVRFMENCSTVDAGAATRATRAEEELAALGVEAQKTPPRQESGAGFVCFSTAIESQQQRATQIVSRVNCIATHFEQQRAGV